ncbi:hypothetical protein Rhow_002504 [Rhodococcus wratislaviensis]|uniref:Uncharacterized protein n=1 Tax=Rhodococcus wratislaviensis TaxID=44752 RepID=A0A402C5S3_RHOWR|nr:hypothetical protein Rhow_002504 [Rhodococcus wratislaviensis]
MWGNRTDAHDPGEWFESRRFQTAFTRCDLHRPKPVAERDLRNERGHFYTRVRISGQDLR